MPFIQRAQDYIQGTQNICDNGAPTPHSHGDSPEGLINRSNSSNCGVSRSEGAFGRAASLAAVSAGDNDVHMSQPARPSQPRRDAPSPERVHGPSVTVLPALSAVEEAPTRRAGGNSMGKCLISVASRTGSPVGNGGGPAPTASGRHLNGAGANTNGGSASNSQNSASLWATSGQAQETLEDRSAPSSFVQVKSRLAARAGRFARLPVFGQRRRHSPAAGDDGNETSSATAAPGASCPISGETREMKKAHRSSRAFQDATERERCVGVRAETGGTEDRPASMSAATHHNASDGNQGNGSYATDARDASVMNRHSCSFSANMYSPQPGDTGLPRTVLIDVGGAGADAHPNEERSMSPSGRRSSPGNTATRIPRNGDSNRPRFERSIPSGGGGLDSADTHPARRRAEQLANDTLSHTRVLPHTRSGSASAAHSHSPLSTVANASTRTQTSSPHHRSGSRAVLSPNASMDALSVGSSSFCSPIGLATSRKGPPRQGKSRSGRSSRRRGSLNDESDTEDSEFRVPLAGFVAQRSLCSRSRRDDSAEEDGAPSSRTFRDARAVLRKHARNSSIVAPQPAATASLRSSHGGGNLLKSSRTESFSKTRSGRRDASLGSGATGRPSSALRRDNWERSGSQYPPRTSSFRDRSIMSPSHSPSDLNGVSGHVQMPLVEMLNVSVSSSHVDGGRRPSLPNHTSALHRHSGHGNSSYRTTRPHPAAMAVGFTNAGSLRHQTSCSGVGEAAWEGERSRGESPLTESTASPDGNSKSTTSTIGPATKRAERVIHAVPVLSPHESGEPQASTGSARIARLRSDSDVPPIGAPAVTRGVRSGASFTSAATSSSGSSSSDEHYAAEHQKKLDAVIMRLTMDHKPLNQASSAMVSDDTVNATPASPAGPPAPQGSGDAAVTGSWAGIGGSGWAGFVSLGGYGDGDAEGAEGRRTELALFGASSGGRADGDDGGGAAVLGGSRWLGVGGGALSSEDWYARMRRKAAEEDEEQEVRDVAATKDTTSEGTDDEVIISKSPLPDKKKSLTPAEEGVSLPAVALSPPTAALDTASRVEVPSSLAEQRGSVRKSTSPLSSTTTKTALPSDAAPREATDRSAGAKPNLSTISPMPPPSARLGTRPVSIAEKTNSSDNPSGMSDASTNRPMFQPVPPRQQRRQPQSPPIEAPSSVASKTASVGVAPAHRSRPSGGGVDSDAVARQEAFLRAHNTPQQPANVETVLAEKAATPQPRTARRPSAEMASASRASAPPGGAAAPAAAGQDDGKRSSSGTEQNNRSHPELGSEGSLNAVLSRLVFTPNREHAVPVLATVAAEAERESGVQRAKRQSPGIPLALAARRASLLSHSSDGGEHPILLPTELHSAASSPTAVVSPRRSTAPPSSVAPVGTASLFIPNAGPKPVVARRAIFTSPLLVAASPDATIRPEPATQRPDGTCRSSGGSLQNENVGGGSARLLVPMPLASVNSGTQTPSATRRANQSPSIPRVPSLRDGATSSAAASSKLPPGRAASPNASFTPSMGKADDATPYAADASAGPTCGSPTNNNNNNNAIGSAVNQALAVRPPCTSMSSMNIAGQMNSGSDSSNVSMAVGPPGLHFAPRRRSSLPRVVPLSAAIGVSSAAASPSAHPTTSAEEPQTQQQREPLVPGTFATPLADATSQRRRVSHAAQESHHMASQALPPLSTSPTTATTEQSPAIAHARRASSTANPVPASPVGRTGSCSRLHVVTPTVSPNTVR